MRESGASFRCVAVAVAARLSLLTDGFDVRPRGGMASIRLPSNVIHGALRSRGGEGARRGAKRSGAEDRRVPVRRGGEGWEWGEMGWDGMRLQRGCARAVGWREICIGGFWGETVRWDGWMDGDGHGVARRAKRLMHACVSGQGGWEKSITMRRDTHSARACSIFCEIHYPHRECLH